MAAQGLTIERIELSERFHRDLKGLPPDLLKAVKEAINDLFKNPIPATRRFHSLHGYKDPKVYTIDVLSNKSYKISFRIDGTVATLRRVATHKTIDRTP